MHLFAIWLFFPTRKYPRDHLSHAFIFHKRPQGLESLYSLLTQLIICLVGQAGAERLEQSAAGNIRWHTASDTQANTSHSQLFLAELSQTWTGHELSLYPHVGFPREGMGTWTLTGLTSQSVRPFG